MFFALLFIVLIIAVSIWMLLPAKYNKQAAESLVRRNYAHRGFHNMENQIPENSLAAFALAAEKGYGIELDVRLTRDDRVIVFHDDTLKRVCGVDKQVIDCTYNELLSYRLSGTNETIPLFSEVLACVNGRVPLIVELKQVKESEKLCRMTYEHLKVYNGLYCIESFDPRIVAWFRKNAPEIIRGQLSCKLKEKDMKSPVLRFLLTNLFLNVLSRPHFIAYNAEHMTNPFYRFVTGVLSAIPVGWTIRSEEVYQRQIADGTQMLIFEQFEPDATF